ncbi:transcriptional regulator, AraC family [Allomuricauda ruestringensis DSM 13258]|uniref:Transcriptional regulator, AraC family n=1 Tax=Allomuricauda ruestringensis (strain DSM 13258 / CIP 107369 / LMG 19739 / B1) TaxID=886377 RepID=G2PJ80_ALLRU|nr:AraC family transcriptional regulator [Allomuricauda ruestringensis]AEM71901.1 transcriptional regulator, AraC family [Allomuricauda ruestringensis DSM 13258]
MSIWQILISIFCGVGLFQGLVLAVYLIGRSKFNLSPSLFLGVMLIGIAFRLAKSYFVFLPMEKYPIWGVLAGAAGLWLIGPSYFLYQKCVLKSVVTRIHFLHYLPAFIIIGLGIFNWGDYIISFYYIGLLQMALYFGIGYYFAKYRNTGPLPDHFPVFSISVLILLVCFVVQAYIEGITVYATGSVLAVVLLYFISYKILQNSSLLNDVSNGKTLNKDEVDEVISTLNTIFEKEKLHRSKGLTVADVSRVSGHASYRVSQAINQKLGLRFNDYVNKFRIKEATTRLKDTTANDKVEVIADEVGFSSMSSMYQAFKKETGLTPHAYRRRYLTVTTTD